MNNNLLKGILLVSFGAASYGLLATFVRLAYNDGYNTAEVTFSQALIGLLVLVLINLFSTRNKKTNTSQKVKSSSSDVFKLMLAGTSLGLTSTFYYFSVQTIPVSMAIVLLMQTIWMGVVLESILKKQFPSLGKMLGIVAILFGTILSTNLFFDGLENLSLEGILWGLAAACSYTITLNTTNTVAINLPPYKRSMWMLVGSVIIVSIIFASSLLEKFDSSIFLSYGILLAIFGTVLPPVLFNKGMPLIGVGLGAILSSIEIPVSVMMAYTILNEEVNIYQWLGIILIIATVVVLNLPNKK